MKPASTGTAAPVIRAAASDASQVIARRHVCGVHERPERMVRERERLVVLELEAEHIGDAVQHSRREISLVADGRGADGVRRVGLVSCLGERDRRRPPDPAPRGP